MEIPRTRSKNAEDKTAISDMVLETNRKEKKRKTDWKL